jgi:C_GCAxxG_C_C family probable redox protein
MSEGEKAVTLFDKFNCAQSVFAACGPREGIDQRTCLLVAGAFGGGMGRMGEVCGAVTGALMVLGARCEEMATNPEQARGPLYERVNAFADAEFKSRDLHHTLCARLVKNAVDLLGEK